ncbi:MAG: hypothetical protein WDL87_10895 [Candidatus Omnitrophota bacterium]
MTVPEFGGYFPSENNMDREQLSFYKTVEESLQKGQFIDVQGNIGYVFVYLYKLLGDWNEKGFESLYEYLLYISELYVAEKKLSDYCKFWAYDCLLGLEKYELYLDKTEPENPFGTITHQSNIRLNIQKHVGLEANPIDILLMAGGRKSKITSSNQGIYRDKINEVFSAYAEPLGGWFSVLDKWLRSHNLYEHHLLAGASINHPQLSFKVFAFYSNGHLDEIKSLSKDAENSVRDFLGVPKIGEGWVSETQLFRLLEQTFPQTNVIQHGHPAWLGLQHFDIWFPHWNVAVEYHGLQHFEPVDFFGGKEKFEDNVKRDKRKKDLARRHGIKLFIVTENDDPESVINEINSILAKRNILPPKIN